MTPIRLKDYAYPDHSVPYLMYVIMAARQFIKAHGSKMLTKKKTVMARIGFGFFFVFFFWKLSYTVQQTADPTVQLSQGILRVIKAAWLAG